MRIKRLLHGRCIVSVGQRTDLVTRLFLPERLDEGKHKPYLGELVVIGEGRVGREDGKQIPTVADLGWRPGDTVVCLKRFAHMQGSDFGYPHGDHAMLDDFDILCRINGGVIEPNFGRTIVEMVADPSMTSGGLILPGGAKPKQCRMGRVFCTSSSLDEENADISKGQRYGTLKYGGKVPPPCEPGQFVLFNPHACWAFKADGVEYVALNNNAITCTVPDPEAVELV